MKTFYLVRHAKSSWDNPELRDIERPLNDRGLKDAPFMAKMMRKKEIEPDLLVSSPAIRALTTAAYFKNELDVEGEDLWVRDDIYEAMSHVIIDLINRLPEDCETVMIFGHNPTFTNVANQFTRKYIDNIPTCGAVCIESKAATWPEVSTENSQVVATYFPKDF
ncbi:MAG: hypothetical protein GC192_02995 [Bacteroidetes bacterium]|nr:hypothetical protein [Bacteroidota bacterium]